MDIQRIRSQFPILCSTSQPFVYFDNSATTQKPQTVIDRITRYYSRENANINRGSYPLSNQAARLYRQARQTVKSWIDASDEDEIIFTKGCTESVNLAAQAVFSRLVRAGDNIVVTQLEHSSNYFPWKACCQNANVQFREALVSPEGSLKPDSLFSLTDEHTRLIAISAMSNVTGFRPDIPAIIEEAHRRRILVLIDAAQEIAHHPVSVTWLGCDFLCFSGHKLYGPMGIGVLYMEKKYADQLSPLLVGGGAISPGPEGMYAYRQSPDKFEAGTQHIAGALGLEAALAYLKEEDFQGSLLPYEASLACYLHQKLASIPGVHIFGEDPSSPLVSFTVSGFGSYDIATALAAHGIALRCGAHCAYPLMQCLGVPGLCRVSLAFYNTLEEIDYFTDVLRSVCRRI